MGKKDENMTNLENRIKFLKDEKEVFEKEYIVNGTLKDKTCLSFFALSVTVLSWIFIKSDSVVLFKLKLLIIIYLLIIAILSLVEIILSCESISKQIENHNLAIDELIVNKDKLSENEKIPVISSTKINEIIYDNPLDIYVVMIDNLILFMILFIFLSLISLFIYLIYPLIIKLFLFKNFKSLWIIMTFCINIAILAFLFFYHKVSSEKN